MEKLRRASDQSALARTMCLRECPLAQQRICAQSALDNGEEWGVWAGVQLSGGQSRKKPELAEKREILRRIAVGEINSRQLYDNAALLAKTEDATPLIRRPGWIPLPDTATATADIA
jgi:WhiB family redox-sensing transcriptional regulator